ncbi:MAG: RNA polymerase-binding protein DksA [Comamonadaceae bacterium]|nr:RNA polymerase-binding protein DksA [Comamonadaceae bacterium]
MKGDSVKTTAEKASRQATGKASAKALAARPAAAGAAAASRSSPAPAAAKNADSARRRTPTASPRPAAVSAGREASPNQRSLPMPAANGRPVMNILKKDPRLANNWKSKPVEELTDPEVLAMPDDEYMNDVQMAFFRRKLVALKEGILANAGETTEHLREDTVVVPDPADRATIEEEHALELRTRDRERKLLKKIEQSIARIDTGDYGYCDETGEPIGVGRLLARPTATLSLEAQQRRELKQKMFGD